jgi:hypothetical protein
MNPNTDSVVNERQGKTFPDVKVAIRNKGHGPGARKDSEPFYPGWLYGGKMYEYPVNEITVVPYEVAYFHFAIELQGGKLIREKEHSAPDGSQSWYANRVATHSPYGLTHGRADERDPQRFKEFRAWYSDGIEFKLVKSPRVLSTEEFDRIK